MKRQLQKVKLLCVRVIMSTDECLVESWLDQHDDLSAKVRNDVKKELQTLESDPRARYSIFKRRLSRVHEIIRGDSNWPPSTIKELARLVITNRNFEEQLAKIATQAPKPGQPGLFSSVYNAAASGVSAVLPSIPIASYLIKGRAPRKRADTLEKNSPSHPIITLQQQDDFAFATALQSIAEKDETFKEVVQEFRVLMVELLKPKIRRLSASIPIKVKESLYTSIDRDLGQAFEQRKQKEDAAAWQNLKDKVQECLSQAAWNANDW
jgi:hypothetical protein